MMCLDNREVSQACIIQLNHRGSNLPSSRLVLAAGSVCCLWRERDQQRGQVTISWRLPLPVFSQPLAANDHGDLDGFADDAGQN
jgi:uncharacterized protein (DUF736 family)